MFNQGLFAYQSPGAGQSGNIVGFGAWSDGIDLRLEPLAILGFVPAFADDDYGEHHKQHECCVRI